MTRTRLIISCLFTWPVLACASAAQGFDCSRVGAEIARAEEARRAALEQGESAWKAVVPLVVLARKASSKAAASDAERKLGELRQQAQQEGCVDHVR
jgi:hypothetical protein